MLRIFADYHHGSLYHSLKMLSQRLSAQIWRPIGEDWFKEGYFKIAEPYGNHPDTIKQFLSTAPHENLTFYNNKDAHEYGIQGQYVIDDDAHHSIDYAMTLELFKAVTFDVIIVTYPWHLESWIQLQKKYQPNAKLVLQVGNNGWSRYFDHVSNVLSSARHHVAIPAQLNYTEYHQEFPLDVFAPVEPIDDYEFLITSFVNCLPRSDLYQKFAESFPEFRFEAWGGGCPQGSMTGIQNIANKMAKSKFGYHIKPGGDGYGHVLHNWFAVGRPIFADLSDYKGTMAEDLLVPNQTFINVPFTDRVSPDFVARIRAMTKEEYEEMCMAVRDRFQAVVDFDNEYDTKLKPFFERLI